MTWSFLPTALISVGWRCDGSRPCLFWPLLDHSLALLSKVHSSELMTSGYATLYHTLPHCCLNLSSSSLQGSASWVTDTPLNTGPVLLISGATQMTSLAGLTVALLWSSYDLPQRSLPPFCLNHLLDLHWPNNCNLSIFSVSSLTLFFLCPFPSLLFPLVP